MQSGSLVKQRTSQSAEREFCSACGSAMSITYKGQRGVTWLAAASLIDVAASVCSSIRRNIHICVASTPLWNRPEWWPHDGLKRVLESYEGEEDSDDEQHQFDEAFRRSLVDHGPRDGLSDGEDADVLEAVRRSLSEVGTKRAFSDSTVCLAQDTNLEEAMCQSLQDVCVRPVVSQHNVGHEQVVMLVDLAQCSQEDALAALFDAKGNVDVAAMALLARASATVSQSQSSQDCLSPRTSMDSATVLNQPKDQLQSPNGWGNKRLRTTPGRAISLESDDEAL